VFAQVVPIASLLASDLYFGKSIRGRNSDAGATANPALPHAASALFAGTIPPNHDSASQRANRRTNATLPASVQARSLRKRSALYYRQIDADQAAVAYPVERPAKCALSYRGRVIRMQKKTVLFSVTA
jgi:hypothetical protein